MEIIKLNNGIEMPATGFGVYQIADPIQCEQSVYDALMAGYHLIDTAAAYCNEEAVGRAIKRSGIPREKLFITTKIWIQEDGAVGAPKALETALRKLGLDYVDLYLTHQPYGDLYGTWRSMEKMYKEGKIRAIGVCNLMPDRLVDLILHNEIVPAVCQIETHPFYQQEEMNKLLCEHNIIQEAWGPFDEGKHDIFHNELLSKIASKYNKSVAQVILRWMFERGIVTIPKSVHKERIEENIDIFDFTLGEEDMAEITTLDTKESSFFSFYDPNIVKSLGSFKIED